MKKLLIICFALLCQACVTYKKCMDKFAQSISDTVTVTKKVTLNVPKDSLIYNIHNDTIPFWVEVQQGRAKLTINKTSKNTIIKADCDSVTKEEIIKYKQIVTTNHIGISPGWKTGFFVLLGGFILALLCIVILYFTKR